MKTIAAIAVFSVAFAFAPLCAAETYPDPLVAGPDVYKKVFENDRVRVSEITFQPGQEIPMHTHAYDHFVYVMEPGQLTIKSSDGTEKPTDLTAGQVLWMGPETHAAKNTGTTRVRALVSEIKK